MFFFTSYLIVYKPIYWFWLGFFAITRNFSSLYLPIKKNQSLFTNPHFPIFIQPLKSIKFILLYCIQIQLPNKCSVTPHPTSKILSVLGLPVHPNPGLPPRSPSWVCSWQPRMAPKRVLLVKVSMHL